MVLGYLYIFSDANRNKQEEVRPTVDVVWMFSQDILV